MWVLIGVGAACLLLCGFGGFAAYKGVTAAAGQVGPLFACQIDIQAARNSILDYAEAHNGKLPSAKNWQDDIKPFYGMRHAEAAKEVKNAPDFMNVKFSSIDGVLGCQLASGKVQAFTYNETFSGQDLTAELRNSQEFVLFESASAVRNSFGKYTSPPVTSEMIVLNEKRDWIKIRLSGDPEEASFGTARVKTSTGE